MGRTIAEKIFSRQCGQNVRAGETVAADVDWAMATGQPWFLVPKSTKVIMHGKLAHGSGGKDAALNFLRI